MPFILPRDPLKRIDLYAAMFMEACAMLRNHDDPCPLPMNEGMDESQPPSSSVGQVTNNAKTDVGRRSMANHYQDSNASFETVKEEALYDHDSKDSNYPSLKHNRQETIVEPRPCVYLWGPQYWLRHPRLYCKYMDRYLFMPFESQADSATSLPSLGPSYGVVNDVAPDLAKIVEQIEYYFSFDNLIHDVNFRDHMDYLGWVPLPFVASLPEVRELTTDVKVIEDAVRTSFAIEILDGTKLIRHRHSWHKWISLKSYPAMI